MVTLAPIQVSDLVGSWWDGWWDDVVGGLVSGFL